MNIMRAKIKCEISDAQRHYGFFRVTAPQRAHTSDELAHCERLRQIIIRSKLQSSYAVIDSAAGGEQQHAGDEMLPAQPSQNLEPIDSGQANIKHDKVER